MVHIWRLGSAWYSWYGIGWFSRIIFTNHMSAGHVEARQKEMVTYTTGGQLEELLRDFPKKRNVLDVHVVVDLYLVGSERLANVCLRTCNASQKEPK